MIGEVGGIISLFLGWDMLGLVTVLLLKFHWPKLRRIFIFALWLCFVYLATQGFLKFLDQPIATDVSLLKLSSIHDIPYITICSSYGDWGLNYIEKVKKSIANNQTWSEGLFTLDETKQQYIINPYVKIDNLVIQLDEEKIYSSVYHRKYDLCFTLDMRMDPNLPKIIKGHLTFGFSTGSSSLLKLLLHEKLDFPVAIPHINPSYDGRYTVRKTKHSFVSTTANPCADYHTIVCQDIELHKMIENDHNCLIPSLYFGKHIKMNQSLAICNNSIVLNAIDLLEEQFQTCDNMPPCKYSMYSIKSMEISLTEKMEITFDDNLEIHESFVSYDTVSLYGEVGGTGGMVLGWSALYIAEQFCCFVISSKLLRNQMTRLISLILLLVFFYWSSDVVGGYINENETMELVQVNLCQKLFFGQNMGRTSCVQKLF